MLRNRTLPLVELALTVCAFVRTRWMRRFRSRAALLHWQQRKLRNFLSRDLARIPFYTAQRGRSFADFPVVDKCVSLGAFSRLNRYGLSLDLATQAATASEQGEAPPAGFPPELTAGLSSGTSGSRGVFLASTRERAVWAGILLARTLDRSMICDLLIRRAPLRVAFFLRANSTLYTTLRSRRIDFRFFDMRVGIDAHITELVAFAPEILVAPASVLAWIANEVEKDTVPGQIDKSLRRIISVAEVLEPEDENAITRAFALPVHQLYQCTEGFLGYTCPNGGLHLNEEFVHIEPEWIDEAQTRFTPIVTDFTRSSQVFVRYRLNDILRIDPTPCPCGNVTTRLAAVDGRADDILWFPYQRDGKLGAVFPDTVRHAIARTDMISGDYYIEQDATQMRIAADSHCSAMKVCAAVDELLRRQGLIPYSWVSIPFPPKAPETKRRRIVCARKPRIEELAYFQKEHDVA